MESGTKHRRWIVVAFAVAALLVVLDQWSKSAVFAWLAGPPESMIVDPCGHRRVELVGSGLGIMQSCNPGAAFGRFGDYPRTLVGGRIIAVGCLVWFLLRSDPDRRAVFLALTLILAGAVGNLLDNLFWGCTPSGGRAGFPHGVRDFIDVWFEPIVSWNYHFPSFNLADSCITVGACLWLLSGLFHREAGMGGARKLDAGDGPPSS